MAILPGGIPTAETIGSPKTKGCIRSWKPWNWRTRGKQILSAGGIPSAEDFGTPDVQSILRMIIGAGGIPSAQAFGSHRVYLSETIWANSPGRDDVQAAIDAASDGDTVRIPGGAAAWYSGVIVPYGKGIRILGDGVSSTVITKYYTGALFTVRGQESHPWRIAHIGFIINTTAGNCIRTMGDCETFRIDHCDFRNTFYTSDSLIDAVWFGDLGYDGTGMSALVGYGLMDHCYFLDCRAEGIRGDGHRSWSEPLGLGGPDAVYIEDCIFDQHYYADSIDGNFGARWVIRRNTFYNTPVEFHALQEQNVGYTDGFGRGTRKVEVYENTFEAREGYWHPYRAIFIRGGTGVVFDNLITNGPTVHFEWAVQLDNVRTNENRGGRITTANGNSDLDGNTAVAGGDGAHTGANGASILTCAGKTWTPNAYATGFGVGAHVIYNITDGSKGYITANAATTVTATLSGGTRNNWNVGDAFVITNGYPALDQIGRSTDAHPYGSGDYSPQELVPLASWNNPMNGAHQDVSVANSCERHIQADRDYYEYKASFNGSSGIGRGLLSARPSSGLTIGVFYWATDTRTLYRATGATTWEVYYQPYIYPHPLQSDPFVGD